MQLYFEKKIVHLKYHDHRYERRYHDFSYHVSWKGILEQFKLPKQTYISSFLKRALFSKRQTKYAEINNWFKLSAIFSYFYDFYTRRNLFKSTAHLEGYCIIKTYRAT